MSKRAATRLASLAGLVLGAFSAFVSSSCSQGVTITAPRYALVYGVSIYQSMNPEGNSLNLSYSDDDAKSMSDLMTSQGWTVYSRIKGDIVPNDLTQEPTKLQLQSDISHLASTISTDSTVFVYFSGHGYTTNGVPYIVPYLGVTDAVDYSIDLSACISPADLNAMLAQLPTKNVIVVFDTCYSGGFVAPGSAIDTIPQNYGPNDGGTAPSAFDVAIANFGTLLSMNASASGSPSPIVISAAGSLESSYDGTPAMQHGVFTYYLLEAAKYGDSDGDGFVTATEAYAYAAAKVNSDWNSIYQNVLNTDTLPWEYEDFYPHISGGTRDLVLFGR